MRCDRCGGEGRVSYLLMTPEPKEVYVCGRCNSEGWRPLPSRRGIKWRRQGAVRLYFPFLLVEAPWLKALIRLAASSRLARILCRVAVLGLPLIAAAPLVIIVAPLARIVADPSSISRTREFFSSLPPGYGLVGIPSIDPMIPLFEGIAAFAVALLVHELSHGVVMEMLGYPVSRAGIVLLGPLPVGAYVEGYGHERASREMLKIAGAGVAANVAAAAMAAALLIWLLVGVRPLTVEAAAALSFFNSRLPVALLLPQQLLAYFGFPTPIAPPDGMYTHVILGPGYVALASLLSWVFLVNVYVAVLNALPVYPLDGGHMMLGLLRRCGMGYKSSYRLTSAASLALTVTLLVLVAIYRL